MESPLFGAMLGVRGDPAAVRECPTRAAFPALIVLPGGEKKSFVLFFHFTFFFFFPFSPFPFSSSSPSPPGPPAMRGRPPPPARRRRQPGSRLAPLIAPGRSPPRLKAAAPRGRGAAARPCVGLRFLSTLFLPRINTPGGPSSVSFFFFNYFF